MGFWDVLDAAAQLLPAKERASWNAGKKLADQTNKAISKAAGKAADYIDRKAEEEQAEYEEDLKRRLAEATRKERERDG